MKELIKNSGLTIKEFAEEYKIPYNTVRQWANGEREAPAYIKNLIEENRNLKTKSEQLPIGEKGMLFIVKTKREDIKTWADSKKIDLTRHNLKVIWKDLYEKLVEEHEIIIL